MKKLEEKLVKLGKHRKDLRPHIRPILAEIKESNAFDEKEIDRLYNLNVDLNDLSGWVSELQKSMSKAKRNDVEDKLDIEGPLNDIQQRFQRVHDISSELLDKVNNLSSTFNSTMNRIDKARSLIVDNIEELKDELERSKKDLEDINEPSSKQMQLLNRIQGSLEILDEIKEIKPE